MEELDDDFTQEEINALIEEQALIDKQFESGFGFDDEVLGTDEFQGF